MDSLSMLDLLGLVGELLFKVEDALLYPMRMAFFILICSLA